MGKEDKQIANQCIKICSTSLSIREIQIKAKMRFYYTPIRIAEIPRKDKGTLVRIYRNYNFPASKNAKSYSYFEKLLSSSLNY